MLAGASTIMPVNARSRQNLKSRYKVAAKVRAVKQPILPGRKGDSEGQGAGNPAVARVLAAAGRLTVL
jgi:hypothetical protein